MGAAQGEPPAVARQRVRRALRAARKATNLIQGEVAMRLGWSLSKVQRIESGEVGVSETDLRALLDIYGVADENVVSQLAADARTSRRQRSWMVPEYRQFLTPALRQLLQFEAEAVAIRAYQPFLVPGVLQTPAMAEFVLGWFDKSLSADQRRVRRDVRILRGRRIIDHDDAPEYLLVLDEGALKREIGGPETMAEQLEALAVAARRPNIHVRIVPWAEGAPVGSLGPFVVLDLSDDDAEDALLYRETYASDELTHDPEGVAFYRERFDAVWQQCYIEADSLNLIEAEASALRAAVIRTNTHHPSVHEPSVHPPPTRHAATKGSRLEENQEVITDG